MRRRLELKVCSTKMERVQALCLAQGGQATAVREQLDTCFFARDGHLLLRREGSRATLLSYRRLDSPLLQESQSFGITIEDPESLESLLNHSLGIRTQLRKLRRTYAWPGCEVHLDQVDGLDSFVEVAVDMACADPRQQAEDLQQRLGLEMRDAVPYSYADLSLMLRSSESHRSRLKAGAGRLFLVDGASCSGKTTLVNWLLEQDLGLHLVPRYCTRQPRPGETSGSEYLFVSLEEFRRLTARGELIEYRDFEFGMSYGLPWRLAVEILNQKGNGLGIMNLGNIRHLNRVFPEAVTILVRAPVEVIRRRLVARGMNAEEQIRERLGNAELVDSYREFYDHVVDNDDGCLETAKERLLEILHIGADERTPASGL